MFVLFTLPEPSTLLTAVGVWSSPFFNEFLPFGYFVIGVSVGLLVITIAIDLIVGAVSRLINR